MSDKKGIALITVIILILVISVAALGMVTFISSGFSLNVARSYTEGAVSAAQAGVFAAINDYTSSQTQPYWTKATSQNISGNIYYNVGKDANFLLVSSANSQRSGRVLNNIPLGNTNETQAITINRMRVEWQNFSANLTVVQLGGVQRWSGSLSSPADITLTPAFTINAKQLFSQLNDNFWRFNRNIPIGAIITATFIIADPPQGDGSKRKAIVWTSAAAGRKNEFLINSTGEVKGDINWKRSIEATYDVGSGVITSWQEAEGHL